MLDSQQKRLVQSVSFNVIELFPLPLLLFESLALVDRVVQLRKRVRQLSAQDECLETLHHIVMPRFLLR